VFTSILKQITLAKKLSYYKNVLSSSILANEFDDIGMMALLEYAYFSFEHLSLTIAQFCWLYHFDCYKIFCTFLFTFVNIRKVTFANTL